MWCDVMRTFIFIDIAIAIAECMTLPVSDFCWKLNYIHYPFEVWYFNGLTQKCSNYCSPRAERNRFVLINNRKVTGGKKETNNLQILLHNGYCPLDTQHIVYVRIFQFVYHSCSVNQEIEWNITAIEHNSAQAVSNRVNVHREVQFFLELQVIQNARCTGFLSIFRQIF